MYPLPEFETERIAALRAADILDSPPAPDFDRVVELVRDLLGVPICLVSLLDTDRQWFKAKCGVDLDGTGRDAALCNYTLLSDDVLAVEDMRLDPRFRDNPFVCGAPNLRFYAGAPLLVRPGVALGTLCVAGSEPRGLTPAETQMLRRLAQVVTGLIRGHGLAREAARLALEADSQRLRLEEQARDLRLRERRFLQTERIARVGGWELDLATNLIDWSDETYRIYEIPSGTPIDLDQALFPFPPKERVRLQAVMQRSLLDGCCYDEEFEIKTVSNTWKWVRAVGDVEYREGVATRLFGTFQDVSERHRVEERLWAAANRDSLTGLANRNRFDALMVGAQGRTGGCLGMLMVDADHLKAVNDTLGHDAGDRLLRAVADRLREAVGEAGTVARVGGDEFAVLLPAPADATTIDAIAEAILAAMSPLLVCEGYTLKPSVSIGGAIGDAGGDIEVLRQSADLALYHAKATRRGGFVFFYDGLKAAILERTRAVDVVDDALNVGDVMAFYQPVVDLATGRVVGLEALARVRQGDVIRSIGEFATALDDRRTATRLTGCMLGRIEADVIAWRAAGLDVPQIALNLGAFDFQEGTVEAQVLACCERAGLPLSRFAVEVTESVFLSRGADIVAQTAARLRSRGVKVALDDFGTGHASLAHLGTFPVDVIKMDRSFVMRMNDGGPGGVIATALVGLAHQLDIEVVAEGIEHEAQLERLAALGCEKGQGFLFAQALPPADLLRFLAAFQMPGGRQKAAARSKTPLRRLRA